MSPAKKALIYFTKVPKAGMVKTRLQPELTPEEARRVHLSSILDTLAASSSLKGVTRFVGCEPTRKDPFFRSLADRFGVVLIDQAGIDLGSRMENALTEARRLGFAAAVIVGTDCPTLPIDFIHKAFKSLRTHSLVLGPSLDGGYYLIGCTGNTPPIFTGVEWGTEKVLLQTFRRISDLKLDADLLPFWYDIDTFRDLQFLSGHLRYLRRRAGKSIAPETTRVLRTLKHLGL